MINITVNEMVNCMSVFNKLMTQECKGAIALKIARVARELNKEYTTFDEQRQKIIDKYCKKDESGNPVINGNEYVIDPQFAAESTEEFNALMNEELEINVNKLDLEEIEDFTLNAQEVMKLHNFFNE